VTVEIYYLFIYQESIGEKTLIKEFSLCWTSFYISF